MVSSLDDALQKLEGLYAACPGVACFACGACCVDPHMTFVEFAYLLDRLMDEKPREKLMAMAAANPLTSEDCPGNLKCPLQEGNLCEGRSGRSLSCRLEGALAIDRLMGRDKPICANWRDKIDNPACNEEKVGELVAELNEINLPFHSAFE